MDVPLGEAVESILLAWAHEGLLTVGVVPLGDGCFVEVLRFRGSERRGRQVIERVRSVDERASMVATTETMASLSAWLAGDRRRPP